MLITIGFCNLDFVVAAESALKQQFRFVDRMMNQLNEILTQLEVKRIIINR